MKEKVASDRAYDLACLGITDAIQVFCRSSSGFSKVRNNHGGVGHEELINFHYSNREFVQRKIYHGFSKRIILIDGEI